LPSKGAITILGLLLLSLSARAGTYLSLEDETYDLLQRLEAEGVIESGLLSTRPLSYKEVLRLISEAESNAKGKGPFIQEIIKSLKEKFKNEDTSVGYIKPLDTLYIRFIYSNSRTQLLNYNMEGDSYKKGLNERVGFILRSDLGWFSFYANPELRHSEKDNKIVFRKIYGVFNLSGWELTVGKDSQWWGPGYHGAILLTNNAEPFTMIRITNSEPVILPWKLRYLGPFRFTFFVTKLEKERTVPEPYLWGMRFNFKPHPYVEVGLSRTALLGGRGRPEDLKTWWKSFIGKGEHEIGSGAGDQRAGGDIKITLPLKIQPIQLYAETAGENSAGLVPVKLAYLVGLYLPRILSFENLSFRLEYATTYVSERNRHKACYTAYTYKGKIIGHHLGTDSDDFFFELSYTMPGRGRISLSYDIERHNLSEPVKEEKKELAIQTDVRLTKDLYLRGSYGYAKIKDRTENIVSGTIYFKF